MRRAALHWKRGSAHATAAPRPAGGPGPGFAPTRIPAPAPGAGPIAGPIPILIPVLILALSLALSLTLSLARPARAAEQAAAAPKAQAASQSESQTESGDAARLRAELAELQRRDLWLDHELARHAAYLDQRRTELERLERRKAAAARLREDLPPLLDRTLDRLEAAVRADLPFLAQERARRLEALRAVLRAPEATPGERLRRLLEALCIEARYGAETATEETVVDVDDRERVAPETEAPDAEALDAGTAADDAGPTGTAPTEAPRADLAGFDAESDAGTAGLIQGRTLRLGRLAEYFLARDGQRAWLLDAATGRWLALPPDGAEAVARALDMRAALRPAGLLVLPAASPVMNPAMNPAAAPEALPEARP